LKKVCLFYLADPKYGGWPTYASHLYRGLVASGIAVSLYKIRPKSDGRNRDFGRGITYQNISLRDAIHVVQNTLSFVVCVGRGFHESAAVLIGAGAAVCVHDPTELKSPLTDAIQNATVVVIRETMLKHIPNAAFIKHPYCPRGGGRKERSGACAISRIDHDKNTKIIVEANCRLAKPVAIYGAVNGIYSHFTLDASFPEWKRNYRGTPDASSLWACQKIACQFDTVIDLSVIKGDGAGTQYTFLEALDAGCGLILHRNWNASGLLADVSVSVGDARELIDALEIGVAFRRDAAVELMSEHCHAVRAIETFNFISQGRK
jgi:hypothetical protein